MSCDIFDLHICQDRWKLENWCLLLTQVDCQKDFGGGEDAAPEAAMPHIEKERSWA